MATDKPQPTMTLHAGLAKVLQRIVETHGVRVTQVRANWTRHRDLVSGPTYELSELEVITTGIEDSPSPSTFRLITKCRNCGTLLKDARGKNTGVPFFYDSSLPQKHEVGEGILWDRCAACYRVAEAVNAERRRKEYVHADEKNAKRRADYYGR